MKRKCKYLNIVLYTIFLTLIAILYIVIITNKLHTTEDKQEFLQTADADDGINVSVQINISTAPEECVKQWKMGVITLEQTVRCIDKSTMKSHNAETMGMN